MAKFNLVVEHVPSIIVANTVSYEPGDSFKALSYIIVNIFALSQPNKTRRMPY